MKGLNTKRKNPGQPVRDEELRALLRQWEGLAAPQEFEEAVWHRIRTCSTICRPGVWELLRAWWQPQTALAGVAAVAVALVGGVLIALLTPGGRPAEHHALLRPGTLAGSYLAMSAEGAP